MNPSLWLKLLLGILTSLAISTQAQNVYVSEKTEDIKGNDCFGQETLLNLESKAVTKDWGKKLREYGKVTKEKNIYKLVNATIPTISAKPVDIISFIDQNETGTRIWYAVKLSTDSLYDQYISKPGCERFLHDFGVELYVNDVNRQIEEAEKELQMAEKFHERQIKEGDRLESQKERIRVEKIRLQDAFISNKSDSIVNVRDIEQNRADQEYSQNQVNEMIKQVDLVKDKLNHIK